MLEKYLNQYFNLKYFILSKKILSEYGTIVLLITADTIRSMQVSISRHCVCTKNEHSQIYQKYI